MTEKRGHRDRSEPSTGREPATANDAFKRSYGNWISAGLIAAVVVHVAFFQLFPKLQAAELAPPGDETELVELPPPVEIPPPPDEIRRPARPVIPETSVEDVTIARTTPEANPIDELPPPSADRGIGERPVWIERDVEPRLTNDREIQRLLQRLYPPMLKDAGIGGRVILWLLVDERGDVAQTQVQESSGYEAFDEAAARVAEQMEFRPAQNRDRALAVWVSQVVTFRVQ